MYYVCIGMVGMPRAVRFMERENRSPKLQFLVHCGAPEIPEGRKQTGKWPIAHTAAACLEKRFSRSQPVLMGGIKKTVRYWSFVCVLLAFFKAFPGELWGISVGYRWWERIQFTGVYNVGSHPKKWKMSFWSIWCREKLKKFLDKDFEDQRYNSDTTQGTCPSNHVIIAAGLVYLPLLFEEQCPGTGSFPFTTHPSSA